jgi:3-oxoacyl-[acyl-carrier protein] reductase
MGELSNKVAIVTGGSRGIGKQVALTMASYGAKIVVADIDEACAKETAKEILISGGQAIAVKVDVTNKEKCANAVKKTVQTFGAVDILANCAGINVACRMIDMTDEIWDKINSVNLKGTVNMNQAAARIMVERKYGKIVNISSISGKTPEAMNGAYCASKAGVMMVSQVFAMELAEYGINVNAVCPGPTNTIIMKEVFEQRGPLMGMTPDEFKEEFLKDIPLHRMAEPLEIAELVSFLASDRASYITGQCYTIAGGKIWT